VAAEAIKADQTAAQIAQMFGVYPTQVGGWKKQALAGLPIFSATAASRCAGRPIPRRMKLYKQIGHILRRACSLTSPHKSSLTWSTVNLFPKN